MRKNMGLLLVLVCLVLTLAVPASAFSETYIMEDDAPLFDAAVAAEIEQQCARAAELYGCGIYTVILDDFSIYDPSAYEAAKVIYRERDLGVGENKNGILLMLSMSERDYGLICYGDIANSVFTDEVQEQIKDAFLDDLGEDNWDCGLKDYVASSIHVLANFDVTVGEAFPGYYQDGVYYPPVNLSLVQVVQSYWPLILAFSVVLTIVMRPTLQRWLERSMYTAAEKFDAEEYVPDRGMKLTKQEDRFSHEEVRTVYHYEDDSDSDDDSDWATTVDSDGFSGSSGKF